MSHLKVFNIAICVGIVICMGFEFYFLFYVWVANAILPKGGHFGLVVYIELGLPIIVVILLLLFQRRINKS